jgi:hypothetical protein
VPLAAIPEDMDVPDTGSDPVAALVNQQQGGRLLIAIRRLPVSYRQIVTWTLEDLSYADIAEVVGISEEQRGCSLDARPTVVASIVTVRHQLDEPHGNP